MKKENRLRDLGKCELCHGDDVTWKNIETSVLLCDDHYKSKYLLDKHRHLYTKIEDRELKREVSKKEPSKELIKIAAEQAVEMINDACNYCDGEGSVCVNCNPCESCGGTGLHRFSGDRCIDCDGRGY